jgi:pimeloyl-ACP methyl ester carboxylesterase
MNPLFVHGVPETFHIWEDVLERLGLSLDHALSLPGFLEDADPGFEATKDDYVDWLIAEVERVGKPVDLVGHDWGFILATRVASLRPELVRTLIGGSGPISATYEWHPLARIWREEGAGEEWFRTLNPNAFAQNLIGAGVRAGLAHAEALRLQNPSMHRSILRLYRSSVSVGAVWERDLHRVTAAALLIWGAKDDAVPVRCGEQLRDHRGRAPLVRLRAFRSRRATRGICRCGGRSLEKVRHRLNAPIRRTISRDWPAMSWRNGHGELGISGVAGR